MPSPPIVPSPAEPVPAEYDLLCEHCGYSLIGITSDRCPECGEKFDATQLPLARVPWLYRSRLGRISAYARTVGLILSSPKDFATEVSRPVRISKLDAFQFRRLTIWIALLTCALTAVAILIIETNRQLRGSAIAEVWTIAAIFGPIGWVALWAFFWLATDMPTFIWRGLDADPIDLAPLHHYAIAPLAIVPIIGLCAVVIDLTIFLLEPRVTGAITGLIACYVLGMLWYIPQRFMHAATRCGFSRRMWLGVYLPIHWFLIAAMCGMGFFAIAGGIGALMQH